jgi:hypothetical protein
MRMLSSPRYETRLLPVELRRGARAFAVFDTFTQSRRSDALLKTDADACTRAANRRYNPPARPSFGY